MELVPYNTPKDKGHAYSPIERNVLNQLRELNVAQDWHHNFCNVRFHDLDEQIHNVHDMLVIFYHRDYPQDNGFRIMHYILCCISIVLYFYEMLSFFNISLCCCFYWFLKCGIQKW